MNWRVGVLIRIAGMGLGCVACDDGVIPNVLPVAIITNPSQDTTVILPYALDFLGGASDADGAVSRHHWDFGDGNQAGVEDPGTYSYTSVGRYTVTYQVTDDDDAVSAPATVDITVTAAAVAPDPGRWFGSTEFSLLQFTLNAQGTAITELVVILDTLPCSGGPSATGRLTSTPPVGWPVSGLQFTMEAGFSGGALAFTVQGTFTSHHEASGTWIATSAGHTCSGSWQTERAPPEISVVMSAAFTQTRFINGFDWLPGRAVTLEIDNHANGTVDFDSTARADWDGVARFNEGNPPFSVAEGDTIKMFDGRWRTGFVVLYLTVDAVDAGANVLRGRAREGTQIRAHVYDGSRPLSEGAGLGAVADAAGTWMVDFSGVFDIVSGTRCLVSASCRQVFGGMACGGSTSIER